ncbi:MAG: ankyrin repeat domain-containing protein, partial [Clostridia bacterium]|nr:ankyrin repeat domain-containing protein [Clostridia bacterium]
MFLQACKNNQKGVVQTFLKRGGIHVNKRDESGNTPLIYACIKNSRDVVKLLLENGADSELCNIFSRAPLHFAAESGNKEIIALIVDSGAD